MRRLFFGIFVSMFILNFQFASGEKIASPLIEPKSNPLIEQRLIAKIEKGNPDAFVAVWVFFTDKEIFSKEEYEKAIESTTSSMLERTRWRRAKVGKVRADFMDLPVSQRYINEIIKRGGRLRNITKWFNGASFEIKLKDIQSLSLLPFVKEIQLVKVFKGIPEQNEEILEPEAISPPIENFRLNYGPSFWQNQQINVPICHDSGYGGQGVIVSMHDTGFRKLHPVFDTLRTQGRLVDEWDFVYNRQNTDDGATGHGTGTWSVCGGYAPGQLIGPAYRASFCIYHTEDLRSERKIEEDNWVRAMERGDSVGTDVISSSLGYFTFDPPDTSYTYRDMNGNTAISSKGASRAASLGIVVCNAIGNSGPGTGTLSAPSDAFNILACGAVDSVGNIASFSSRGPSYDGRIKPEVVAKGVSTYWAQPLSSYGRASGTSLSTPLVAGAAAIVFSAHPTWTSYQVRDALLRTANRASNPNNTYGWGLLDVWKAIKYNPSSTEVWTEVRPPISELRLSDGIPNPMREKTKIYFQLPSDSRVTLAIYDITGKRVCTLLDEYRFAGIHSVQWNGKNDTGESISSGIYFYRLETHREKRVKRLVLIKGGQ